MKERIWSDIKGYEGLYIISRFGEVISLPKYVGTSNRSVKTLKTRIDRCGYVTLQLHKNGHKKLCRLHRLLAESFIENPSGKLTVNHKDSNKQNNNIANLEWASYSENNKHAYDMGLNYKRFGKLNGKSIGVVQSDLAGKVLRVWDSANMASSTLNISQSSITLCCQNKRKHAGNFNWKYRREFDLDE